MKEVLSDPEKAQLDALVAHTEKSTGAQIVLALVERSDSYAELPWKAFAFGASLFGFLYLILCLFIFHWSHSPLFAIALVLAGGAAPALLTVVMPAFARFFLPEHRSETEVEQYAHSFFLEHGIFATRQRKGILILISLFERRIIILPDPGMAPRLSPQKLPVLIDEMIPSLGEYKIFRAFKAGLSGLNRILDPDTASTGDDNELPNQLIEEKGV